MKILFILNDAPYGSEKVYNALRLAMKLQQEHAEVEIRIFLMADAVSAALPAQSTPQGYYNIERMLKAVIGPNLVFWLLPWVGALMMWWDERLDGRRRFLLTALFLCSAVSITIGFYFRVHYFIQLLPVLALLIAVAVSRSLRLLRGDQSIELFLALAVLVVSVLAAGARCRPRCP